MNWIIRLAQPDDALAIARVNIATWNTAYRDLMPAEFLASRRVDEATERVRKGLESGDGRCHLVVESAEHGLVGILAGGKERTGSAGFDGELYAIYVLEEFQGEGIGRALVLEFARWLLQNGYKKMLLWVLKENVKSRRFYEAIGGELLSLEQERDFGGKMLAEVAYGWSDLAEATHEEEEPDFYYNEAGLVVFTASYLRKRGYCCGNGCKHCPYDKKTT